MRISGKLTRKRVFAVMILVAILSSLLGRTLSDPLRSALEYALIPLGSFGTKALASFRQAWSVEHEGLSAAQSDKLMKELEDLRSKVEELESRRIYWKRKSMHIQAVRKALRPIKNSCELIPATVVLSSSMPYSNEKTVDAGALKKVDNGMLVVDVMTDRSKALSGKWAAVIPNMSALVGFVVDSGKLASRIRVITDKNFNMQAVVRRDIRNRRKITTVTPDGPTDQTLTRQNNKLINVKVYGTGKNSLVVYDVPKHHNVKPGDQIQTTRHTAILPVRLRIGKVTQVEQSAKNPNFVTLYAEPIVNLDAVRELYVVRPLARLGSQKGAKP